MISVISKSRKTVCDPLETRASPPELLPHTLDELLGISVEELHRVDIARMNLLCGTGLPDTANLDVEELLKQIDAMAVICRARTASLRSMQSRRRDIFGDSEPLWRAYCINRVLRNDFRVHYCEEERSLSKEANWSVSSHHLLHGLLGPERHGTCASMPVLMTAIGRRLGYPMKLVRSPAHVFSRWDGLDHSKPAWREKRNFEFTDDFDTFADEHYFESPVRWDETTHREERQRVKPLFLRSLDPNEELALFLDLRGHVLEAHRLYDGARAAYEAAAKLDPNNDAHDWHARRCHQKQLDNILKRWQLTAHEYDCLLRMRRCGKKFLFPWEVQEGVPSLEAPSSGFNAVEARNLVEFQFWSKMLYPSQGIIPGVLPDPYADSPADKHLLERMQPTLQMPGSPVSHIFPLNSLDDPPMNFPGVPSCTNPQQDVFKASIPTQVTSAIPKASINTSIPTPTPSTMSIRPESF